MPMQQGPIFYIPLKLTCLFDAYCYEFCNRESYDEFVLPVERELIFKNLLFDLLITARNFKNLFYLSSCSLWQIIPKNTLKRITRHWIRPCLHKSIGVVCQYIFLSESIWHPLSSSMLKNKQILSLIISKLISTFSLWLYILV